MSTEHNPDNLTPEHNQDGTKRSGRKYSSIAELREMTEGRLCEKRCPKCYASLFRNKLGEEWCSFIECDFGIEQPRITPEHNPDGLSPEQVGEGWRLLKIGEAIEDGDEVYERDDNYSIHWEKTVRVGCTPDSVTTYRRRITPDAGKAEAGQLASRTETPENRGAGRASTKEFLITVFTEQIQQASQWVEHYDKGTQDHAFWDGKADAFRQALSVVELFVDVAPAQQPAEAMPEMADSELSRMREENERLKERLRAYGYSLATPAPASALLDVLDQWSEPREPKPVTSVAPPQPNGCTCYGTPPTVPVFRDKDDHLPGCPARNRMVDVEAQRWGREVERLERERDHWRGLHVSTLKSLTTALEECDKLIAQLSTERAAREQEFANYKDALDKATAESLTSLVGRLAESESREHQLREALDGKISEKAKRIYFMLKEHSPEEVEMEELRDMITDLAHSKLSSTTVADLRKRAETAERERDAVVKALSSVAHVLSAQRIASVECFEHYKLMAGRLMDEHVTPALATTQETK